MGLFQQLTGIFMVGVLVSGCGKTPAEPTPIVPIVKTATLSSTQQLPQWTLSGTLTARYLPELAFRVSGKVTERLVNVGDTVQANQVLYRLDAHDFQLARDIALANVDATQSDITLAKAELSRLKTLIKRNLTSEQTVDQAKNQLTVLKARLSSQRLQAQQAQNQLNYTVLKSPGLGKITAIQTEAGEVVTAGQMVARLALAGHREVVVQIPEERLQNLPAKAKVTLPGSDRRYTANLREIAIQADPLSRTWEAHYTLETTTQDSDNGVMHTAAAIDDLSLGQTAKLTFVETSSLIKVPITALYEQGDYASLWVVKQGKVYRKPVIVSSLSESSALVSASEGDFSAVKSIVVLGVHLLTEGQAVRESAE
jgi:RND family efflux transporter MFP subunit